MCVFVCKQAEINANKVITVHTVHSFYAPLPVAFVPFERGKKRKKKHCTHVKNCNGSITNIVQRERTDTDTNSLTHARATFTQTHTKERREKKE